MEPAEQFGDELLVRHPRGWQLSHESADPRDQLSVIMVEEHPADCLTSASAPECAPFAVGEVDQSIYGFTGAHPELLRRLFERDDVETVRLGLNYRCGSQIVTAFEYAFGRTADTAAQTMRTRTRSIYIPAPAAMPDRLAI